MIYLISDSKDVYYNTFIITVLESDGPCLDIDQLCDSYKKGKREEAKKLGKRYRPSISKFIDWLVEEIGCKYVEYEEVDL
jgi:hypothetical protein